jgi:hypothetical protein
MRGGRVLSGMTRMELAVNVTITVLATQAELI